MASEAVRIGRESIYRGPIFALHRDRVRLPGGAEVTRDVVEHPGAVVLLPVTAEGRIHLVRQYRYAVGEALLECPAGTLEPGEEPATTAARELREEVGLRPGRLELLGAFYSAPGFCTELLHCYLATELHPAPLRGDPDEAIEVVTLTWEEALRAAGRGEIRDAKSLAALLLAGDRLNAAGRW